MHKRKQPSLITTQTSMARLHGTYHCNDMHYTLGLDADRTSQQATPLQPPAGLGSVLGALKLAPANRPRASTLDGWGPLSAQCPAQF